jgi:isopentenyldiphosphate isomerase
VNEELLDVIDQHGAHLGVKPRGAVHRDGDWHAAFHLWVVSPAGVLLQRRSAAKAAWPGFLDATAAGHLIAGEAVADGLREVREEIGATYPFEALTALGVHSVDECRGEGGHNRERQHVYAVRDDRPLASWAEFDRVELDGLVLVGHTAFSSLVHGDAPSTVARSFDGHREQIVNVPLEPAPACASAGPTSGIMCVKAMSHR